LVLIRYVKIGMALQVRIGRKRRGQDDERPFICLKMALLKWTDSLIGSVSGGAIIGPDGAIWAATPGFYGNPSEFAVMSETARLGAESEAACKGFKFQGELYVVTSITPERVIAQKMGHGIVIARCPKCLVVGFHDEQLTLAKCQEAVMKLAENLRDLDLPNVKS
jgi:hypothetical protein